MTRSVVVHHRGTEDTSLCDLCALCGDYSAKTPSCQALGCLDRPLGQLGSLDARGKIRECRSRSAPLKLVDGVEQRLVAAQSRECLEQQCQLAMFADAVVVDRFDAAEALEDRRGSLRPKPRNAWIAVGRIADERAIVAHQFR